MSSPKDAYAEGYARGKKDSLADNVGEALFSFLRDDPGGYRAAGYHDGAAGRQLNLPAEKQNKPAVERSGERATSLERAWYSLCDSNEFLSEEIVSQYITALTAEGNHAAVVVGLHNFSHTACRQCGKRGHFKIHFLGRITHPVCKRTYFMSTPGYIGHQLAQIVHTGARAGSSIKEDSDRKGDKAGGWMQGILTFLMVGAFRALAALVLIPLHSLVAALEPEQTTGERIGRILVFVLFGAVLGFFFYKVQHPS